MGKRESLILCQRKDCTTIRYPMGRQIGIITCHDLEKFLRNVRLRDCRGDTRPIHVWPILTHRLLNAVSEFACPIADMSAVD
jgi:hypothetical protein